MPIYEYDCAEHGVFERMRPMAECSEPAACPACGVEGPRVLSAVRLAVMSASARESHRRNEVSQHSPRCGHKHAPKPSAAERRRPKRYQGPRPWVVEHY